MAAPHSSSPRSKTLYKSNKFIKYLSILGLVLFPLSTVVAAQNFSGVVEGTEGDKSDLYTDILRDEAVKRLDDLGKVSDVDGYLERTFLSPASVRAGHLLRSWMEDAGLTTWVDQMGNVHGRAEGMNANAKALLIGSHLDTVIDAGKYDGSLGIVSALSALKVLNTSGKSGKLRRPVEVIAFSDEEGVRFQSTFLGSAAIAGILPVSTLQISDKSGLTVQDVLKENYPESDEEKFFQLKYDPESVWGYIEVHIEQGPVLESVGLPLGVVKGIAGQTRLKVSHGSRRENRRLKISKTTADLGSTEWKYALVGHFLGKKLPYTMVTNATSKFWGNHGLVDTLATNSGVYIFKFSSSSTRDWALENGPWYVAGRPIILRPWKRNLKLDPEAVNFVPIWVHLYNIPLELWTPEGLSDIASMLGNPLHVDRMTASHRRISYARVCIEISSDHDLLHEFEIEVEDELEENPVTTTIKVEYQWTPQRCKKCCVFGHDCDQIVRPVTSKSKVHKLAEQWVPTSKPRADPIAIDNPIPGSKAENLWTEVVGKGKAKVDVPPECSVKFSGCLPGSSSSQAQQLKISNSFNELIPFVYEVQEDDDASVLRDTPCDNPEGQIEECEDVSEVAFPDSTNSLSSRQRKRETKMKFSGSRPKGRHRP